MGILSSLFGNATPTEESVVEKIRKGNFITWTQLPNDEKDIGLVWASNVTADYGEILEKYSEPIEDIRLLTHSKLDIINASCIMIIYRNIEQDYEMVSALKACLLSLANFQEMSPSDARLLSNYTNILEETSKNLKNGTPDIKQDSQFKIFKETMQVFNKYSEKQKNQLYDLEQVIKRVEIILSKAGIEIHS